MRNKYRVKVSVYSGCMGVKDTIYYIGCNTKREAFKLAQELEEDDNSNWTTVISNNNASTPNGKRVNVWQAS